MREKPESEKVVTKSISIPAGLLFEMIGKNINAGAALRLGLRAMKEGWLPPGAFNEELRKETEVFEKKMDALVQKLKENACEVCRERFDKLDREHEESAARSE